MSVSGPLDSFGAILSGLAKRLGLETRLVELRIQQRWPDIVGQPMGSHTWPAQIRFKKLYLLVENSVWLQQLTFLKPSLVTRINEEAGMELITDIAFRVGEIPAMATDNGPATPNQTSVPDSDRLSEAESHTASIQDPSLRQRFTEVIATYPAPPQPPPAADRSPAP
ncbi:MAG: DUF721 domain-containing protein [Nitrospira sp.]